MCRRRPALLLLLLLLLPLCSGAGSEVSDAPGQALEDAAAPPPPPPSPHKKWRGKGRRPCRENDAKCIALRDHECDPYYQSVEDKCTFVQYNRHCAQDVHNINYLQLFYCRPEGDARVLVALGFVLWLLVLFWLMSKVAEDFLVPALEYLAVRMRLAPDVAGVTLFAFASGAPDLFTQIAAVAAGGNVDQELAIGATLGAGLFIIAVILSIVMLVARPAGASAGSGGGAGAGEPGEAGAAGSGSSSGVETEPEEITDRVAFVRDAVAYMLSTLAMLALMLRGTFTAWEAGLLLLGYGAYLATCLMTSRGGSTGGRHGAYLAVGPSHPSLHGLGMGPADQQQQQLPAPGAATGPQLSGVVVAGEGVHGALPMATPRAEVELVSRVGGPQPQRKASHASSPSEVLAANGSSRPTSPARGKLFATAEAQQQQQWQQWQQLEGGDGGAMQGENELAALVGGAAPSDAPQAGVSAATAAAGGLVVPSTPPRSPPWQRPGTRQRGGGVLQSASLGLEELLHTRGMSGPRLWLRVIMAPLMLLLHATMPALHAGYYTPWYALTLALGAPLFALLSTGLYPHHLTTPYFILTWLLAALVLYVLLVVAAPPAATGGSNGSNGAVALAAAGPASAGASPLAAVPPGSPFSSSGRLARLSPGPANGNTSSGRILGSGGVRMLGRCCQACASRRPRRGVLLALVASVQCMLWMSVAADELVALFQAIGRIVDVSQDVLGATVLAWGEAVPELVATMSLARSGQATMAIAAVFGGPIFNVLIAWAGPTLYAALRHHGSLPYRLSPGVGLLVLFTLIVLTFLLVAMPLLFRWRLARKAAVAVLSIYALSQLLFLLAA